MSLRRAVLFVGGKGSPIFRAQCTQKGALQPVIAGGVLLDDERKATTYMQGWWRAAFPTRDPLPKEPLANKDGTGTQAFWEVFE